MARCTARSSSIVCCLPGPACRTTHDRPRIRTGLEGRGSGRCSILDLRVDSTCRNSRPCGRMARMSLATDRVGICDHGAT